LLNSKTRTSIYDYENMTKQSLAPSQDLEDVLMASETSFLQLHNLKIMVFGGTGFIGKWLIAALSLANSKFNLEILIVLASRNPQRAKSIFKHLRQKNIIFVDIRELDRPDIPHCDIYIHAATPTTNAEAAILSDPSSYIRITEFIVKSAEIAKNSPIVMHLSSGAVYGIQDMQTLFQPEQKLTTANPSDQYTSAKLQIENLLESAREEGLIRAMSPRLFAFAGPQLPLEAHFAVGNFVRDGMAGTPISVLGNSKTKRSYLYPTDLIHVLIEMLVKLPTQTINVGSDQSITMENLANLVSEKTNRLPIHLLGEEREPSNYVPSIENLRSYVTQKEFINIDEMLERWLSWLKT
jgi:nucleoside-diphosphate-sugar epimerase